MPSMMDASMEDNCVLRLGCLNLRSLARSSTPSPISSPINILMFCQLMRHGTIAICKLRLLGLQSSEGSVLRSLRKNHGGLAVIRSSTVGPYQHNVGLNPSTFELLAALINRGSKHVNLLTVYKAGNLQSQFFFEVYRPTWPFGHKFSNTICSR